MIIPKETIENLKAQGIYVSMFPCDEVRNETYAKILAKNEKAYRFVRSKSYYCKETDEWVEEGDERENYKEYAKRMTDEAFEKTEGYHGMWYDATILYIGKDDMLFKRTVQKGKLVTEEYVLDVIAREQKSYSGPYGQFAKDIHKMFSSKFGNTAFVYPTTYGIGVWVYFNFRTEECVSNVESVLKSLGIEYKNEFSDAGYVYRFKISKKEVNRLRLQKAVS